MAIPSMVLPKSNVTEHDKTCKLVLVPVGYRHPAVSAEGLRRYLYAGGGLAALVLVLVNQGYHPLHNLFVITLYDNLLKAFILLDIRLQYRV